LLFVSDQVRTEQSELESRRAGRRAELLDAADRVIRRDGPDASMTAIATEAGITKPILYRYFGDKGGLYRALAERYTAPILTELRRHLDPSLPLRQSIVDTVDAYLRFIEADPQLYRFLMHRAYVEHPEAHTAVSTFIRVIGSDVASAMEIRLGLDASERAAAQAWGHGIVGMVQVAGDWWLEHRHSTREELVDQLTRLIHSGVASLPTGTPDGSSD
jgi:AcrR family transcriptional regulator